MDAGGEGRNCLLAASSLFFPSSSLLIPRLAHTQTRTQTFYNSDSVTLRYTEPKLTLRLTHTQAHTHTQTTHTQKQSDHSNSQSHSDHSLRPLTHAQTYTLILRPLTLRYTYPKLSHTQTHAHRLTHTPTRSHTDSLTLRLTRPQSLSFGPTHTQTLSRPDARSGKVQANRYTYGNLRVGYFFVGCFGDVRGFSEVFRGFREPLVAPGGSPEAPRGPQRFSVFR